MSEPSLDQLERWMMAVVTHPKGSASGIESPQACSQIPVSVDEIAQVVLPSKNLTSIERLDIYADMYRWRLVDILTEEYPTLSHLLGKNAFSALAEEYIALHPSEHYNLAALSQHFPRFIEEEGSDVTHREFAAEVARLERAMEEVYDAPQKDPVTSEEFEKIPDEVWGEVHMDLIPALELLSFSYPVDEYVTSVRENRHMDIPDPNPSWVVVYRNDFTVWRSGITREQHHLLTELRSGQSLGEALMSCAKLPNVDIGALSGNLKVWFQNWTGNGYFCRLR